MSIPSVLVFLKRQKRPFITCLSTVEFDEFSNIGSTVHIKQTENSMAEQAELVYIGSEKDCLEKQTDLLKKKMDNLNSSVKSTKRMPLQSVRNFASNLSEEALELNLKIQKLTEDNCNLVNENFKLKQVEEEINLSRKENYALAKQVEENNNIFKDLLKQFKNNVTLEAIPPELMKLGTAGNTKVLRSRFLVAKATRSPTAFVQRLVTAVFSYGEVMGATVHGRKRKRDGSIGSECKALPESKLLDLIESVKIYYPKHDVSDADLKHAINWRLNYLNKGSSCAADLTDWKGFDPEDFEKKKRARLIDPEDLEKMIHSEESLIRFDLNLSSPDQE